MKLNQEYLVYAVISLTAAYVMYQLIRQFSTDRKKAGCPGCSACAEDEGKSCSDHSNR